MTTSPVLTSLDRVVLTVPRPTPVAVATSLAVEPLSGVSAASTLALTAPAGAGADGVATVARSAARLGFRTEAGFAGARVGFGFAARGLGAAFFGVGLLSDGAELTSTGVGGCSSGT